MKIEIFQILGILVEFQKPVNTGCFCLKAILSSGFSSEILQLLSSIDKASSKGTEKSTACPIKFQTFIGPHRRFHSDLKLFKGTNPPPVNFFLVSTEADRFKQEIEVFLLRLDVLNNFKETSVKRWKQL